MTARPIGAATRTAGGRQRVAAVLDQHGHRDLRGLGGRERDVPDVRRGVAGIVPCSAVPVLDAICTPAIAPFLLCDFSASTIRSVSLAARPAADTARPLLVAAAVVLDVGRSGL